MSERSAQSWDEIVDEKRTYFARQGCELQFTISNEDDFRSAFEELCEDYKEKYGELLLNKLLSASDRINSFTNAIGGGKEDQGSAGLMSLVWESGYAVLECGCRCKKSLAYLVQLLVDLNNGLPAFDPSRAYVSDDPRIQDPLKDILSHYLDAYLFLVSYCTEMPLAIYNPSQPVSPEDYIQVTLTKIAEAKQRFEVAVDNAEKEAARARLYPPRSRVERPARQASLPSVFQDLDQHPTDTVIRFIHVQQLGQSSTAIVDEVKEASTGETFARKSVYIRYRKDAQKVEADMQNEYDIMKKLTHVHIAKVLFHVNNPEACMVFMVPVAEGNLQSFLEACIETSFPETETESIYSWFGCLVGALAYAHGQQIRHRDIKPANILIKAGRPYLTDFGLSKDFTDAGASSSYANTVFGTPVYRAPEINPQVGRGRAADVFSMGCVFSEMLTVAMRRSLEEFRTYRKGPITALGDHAFRENLAKVNQWLRQLRGDKRTNVLVDEIARMIDAKKRQRRKAAETAELLWTDAGLHCVCTSS